MTNCVKLADFDEDSFSFKIMIIQLYAIHLIHKSLSKTHTYAYGA